MLTRRRLVLLSGGLLAVAAFHRVAIHTPPGPRSLKAFDPDRMAELEVGMWQAYYRRERLRLFALLVTIFHEQYRYTWSRACGAGFHLARAASAFGDARSGYEGVFTAGSARPSPPRGSAGARRRRSRSARSAP